MISCKWNFGVYLLDPNKHTSFLKFYSFKKYTRILYFLNMQKELFQIIFWIWSQNQIAYFIHFYLFLNLSNIIW